MTASVPPLQTGWTSGGGNCWAFLGRYHILPPCILKRCTTALSWHTEGQLLLPCLLHMQAAPAVRIRGSKCCAWQLGVRRACMEALQAIRNGVPRLQGGADSSPQAGAQPWLACWARDANQGEPAPCWRATFAPAKAVQLSVPSLQRQPVSLVSQIWRMYGSTGGTAAPGCQHVEPSADRASQVV